MRAGQGATEGELTGQSRDGVRGAAPVRTGKDILSDAFGKGGEKSPHTPCLITILGPLENILPKNIYFCAKSYQCVEKHSEAE